MRALVLATLVGLACTANASAQEVRAAQWSATGSLGIVGSSGTRDLDDRGGTVGAVGRLRVEAKSAAWRALLEAAAGSDALGYDSAPVLRQGFLEYSTGALQFRAGRQIVAWGRADRLNPTDNLSPRNLRGIVTDLDDDRMGIDLVAVNAQIGPRWNLSLVHVPSLRAQVLPAALAAVAVEDADHAGGPTNAARADYAGNNFDGALSLIEGYAPSPAFAYAAGLIAEQPRVRVLGADFSKALGESWGLRGEYADTRFIGLPPTGLGDFRYAVLGLERHFNGGWLALVQLVHRDAERAALTPAPLVEVAALNRAVWFQSEARSDAVYLGFSRAPFEGNLSGNVGLLQSLDQGSRAFFANIEYRLDDQWRLLGRWQHFSGRAGSNLGNLHRDSVLIVELRRSWAWPQ